MRVIKVGGSLLNWPLLGERLQTFLAPLTDEPLLLIPGGGPLAETIRLYDHLHQLTDCLAHTLALETMSLNARLLAHLLPATPIITDPRELTGTAILDMARFDDPDPLPAIWDVTSDSLALHVAILVGATELILLKSIDIPADMSWHEASTTELVDPYFCRLLAKKPVAVRAVNLRRSS